MNQHRSPSGYQKTFRPRNDSRKVSLGNMYPPGHWHILYPLPAGTFESTIFHPSPRWDMWIVPWKRSTFYQIVLSPHPSVIYYIPNLPKWMEIDYQIYQNWWVGENQIWFHPRMPSKIGCIYHVEYHVETNIAMENLPFWWYLTQPMDLEKKKFELYFPYSIWNP